jgi:hypothetical protein
MGSSALNAMAAQADAAGRVNIVISLSFVVGEFSLLKDVTFKKLINFMKSIVFTTYACRKPLSRKLAKTLWEGVAVSL